MNSINNNNFGNYLYEKRKGKNLTQKELGDKLFVSDKTISKWERGAGMPNIALLLPIAEILEVDVSELLHGETEANETISKETLQHILQRKKYKWIVLCILSILLTLLELFYLQTNDVNFPIIKESIYLLCGLMLTFGCWFTFFAKPLLPSYYDTNNVNFYAQGIFKIHMPGISFTNNNWHYICTLSKIFTLSSSPLYPIVYYAIATFFGFTTYLTLEPYIICVILFAFLLMIYIIAYRQK